jgi:hypothetical protein
MHCPRCGAGKEVLMNLFRELREDVICAAGFAAIAEAGKFFGQDAVIFFAVHFTQYGRLFIG